MEKWISMNQPTQRLRIVPHEVRKKPINRSLFFKVCFLSLICFLLFNRIHSAKGQSQSNEAVKGESTIIVALPERLIIPVIDIDAAIQSVGVTQSGEMDIPSNEFDVGWFKFGPRPGEKGSAVIAGHFNGKNGEVGVFANLNKLKKGDKVYIANGEGPPMVFEVRDTKIYDPGHAEEVFTWSVTPHLNLITCDGEWDSAKNNYSKRLVVFSEML